MAINWNLEHPEVIEEIKALEILIQETNSSLLAFALYQSIADREASVRALKKHLTLPVVEFRPTSKDGGRPATCRST